MKKQTTKSKPVNIFRDHVAGVQYSDAIAVYVHDTRIGYIPRIHTQRFIGLKRDGAKFSGRIVSYNKNNPSWQAIVISVDVTMPTMDDVKDGEVL